MSNKYLEQFKETITEGEVLRRKVLKAIMMADGVLLNEEDMSLCSDFLRTLVDNDSVDTTFIKRNDNQKYVYVHHTFDSVFSNIVKTWLDVELVEEFSEAKNFDEVNKISKRIKEKLIDIINDNETLSSKIGGLREFVMGIYMDGKSKSNFIDRYNIMYSKLNTNATDFVMALMNNSYNYEANIDGTELTGNIASDVSTVLVVDNIFGTMYVYDIHEDDENNVSK